MLQRTHSGAPAHPGITVRLASRRELSALQHWQSAFATERKDHRYYELVEDTLTDGFKYGYLIVEDDQAVRAVQPFFVVDQDLLAGVSTGFKQMLTRVRGLWPRFMHARTLMV
ncbi:MAG: GNAT family N-acetyltransferase, partial [Hyphomicrobiales bacterium]